MEKKVEELEAEVRRLLEEAEAVDAAEDALYGKGKRGDELPEEVRSRQTRLKKIREAMASLEAEAKEKADAKRDQIEQKQEALTKEGKKRRGKKPKGPSNKPDPKAQRNFTDSESRIMKDGATKSFEQAYNCQAAVDEKAQVIVATNVTQQANDKQQLEPLIEEIKSNTDENKPKKVSADSGYFSETNVEYLEEQQIDGFIATNRQKHSEKPEPAQCGRIPKDATKQKRMARKLRTKI